MKRIISAILAISILSGVFHFDELAKISTIRRHYDQYAVSGASTGLAAFLFSHYIIDGGTTADHGEHSKLPFKSENSIQSHISMFYHAWETEFCFILNGTTLFYPESVSELSYFEINIFQPPRSV
jgi:hypothetical protein